MTTRAGLFVRLSFANLRRHRTRWILMIVGIALGVTSFTEVLTMSGSIVASFERSVTRTAGAAQLQVNNGTAGVPAALVDVVKAVPGVEAAGGNVRYGVTMPLLERRMTVFGTALGTDTDYRDRQLGSRVLELPDSLEFLARVDSVALGRRFMQRHGLRLGSTLEVTGPSGPRTLTIRGIAHPSGALRGFGDAVAVMDADAAQHAFGRLDEFHWIDVVVRPGDSVEAVRTELERAVAGRAFVDTPVGRGARIEAMLRTLRTMLTLTGVVAMLVGVFLIYHTVETAVLNRREELVTLWTLGAPRRHLIVHLLLEVSLVGVVGCLVGIGAGIGFARIAIKAFSEVVSNMYTPIPAASLSVSAGQLTLALAFGMSAVLVGALVPCIRALRARERTVGRGSSVAMCTISGFLLIALARIIAGFTYVGGLWTQVSVVATFAALVFGGATLLVPGLLVVASPILRRGLRGGWEVLGTWVWGQIRRRPGHTAVTMGALAAGTAFALGMATLLGSYRHAFVRWIDQAFTADLFVNAGSNVSLLGGPTVGPEVAAEVTRISGVAHVLPWRLVEVPFDGQPIIVQGMAEELIARAHPNITLNHADGDVVISDTLAERYSLSQGDTFTLAAPHGPLSVRVADVAPDYVIDLGNVKVGWETFVRHFGQQGANVLLVDATPGTSPRTLKERMERALASRYDITVLTQGELHRLLDQLIDQSFALTHALEALAVLVVICAMVNSTSAAIVDRADELVTFRALGMLRSRLIRLLMVEAGLVGALGGFLGLFGGTLLGVGFVGPVARGVAGFRFTVRWPISTIVLLELLGVVAAVAAAFFVARGWTRRRIVVEGEAPIWRAAT